MQRQAHKLAAFIKLSSPMAETLEKMKQNTAMWLNNNLHILREHYDKHIATALGEPQQLHLEAFNP